MGHRPKVADSQAGAFTRAQARAAGWSDDQTRHRLRHGIWVRSVGRGLTEAGPAETAGSAAWAAHLTLPQAVISHRTAGLLAGFPLPDEPRPVHVLSGGHHRVAGIVVHRMPLLDHDHTRLGRLPVTTRARTALDCLADLDPPAGLRLWAWVASRSILDPAGLAAAVRDRFGWPGAPNLVALLRIVSGGAASVAERRLHRLLRRAGFDDWAAGAPIRDLSGRIIASADILFERERVILELDGFETHGGRSAFVADRRRIRALSNAGYRVLPVTWDDLDQQPDQLVAEISAALNSRPS